jgi:hypothetical protein
MTVKIVSYGEHMNLREIYFRTKNTTPVYKNKKFLKWLHTTEFSLLETTPDLRLNTLLKIAL